MTRKNARFDREAMIPREQCIRTRESYYPSYYGDRAKKDTSRLWYHCTTEGFAGIGHVHVSAPTKRRHKSLRLSCGTVSLIGLLLCITRTSYETRVEA